jgi:signal transduction histidine kinase
MTWNALPFLITSVTYFALGSWALIYQKNRAQRLYGAICLTTCFWQSIWLVLFSHSVSFYTTVWVKAAYSGVIFIPSVFNHFIIEFTTKETRRSWRIVPYFVSCLFALLICTSHYFIEGFNSFKWGLSVKAGMLHPLFLTLICIIFVKIMYLLILVQRDHQISNLKKRQSVLIIAAIVFYACGAIDLLSNYGFSVFPLSSIFTGIAFVLFTYSISKYELLAFVGPSETQDELQRRIAASQEMSRLGIVASFPLVSQGELLGYLLLGEKMSEESYSKEDLLLLRIVANQAALAYQRVRYLEMAVRGARTEMLGEIAGGFAHEIKTPLANISLPAELSFIDLTDVEQGKRKIEEILPELKQRMKDIMQQTFRASDKIEAIRQFSKPGQVQMEVVDLNKVLQGSLSVLDHTLRKLAINLKTEFPAGIAPIHGNAKQLEIVFVNLVKNAAEAMATHNPAGLARNLMLRGQEEGNWVVVSVKDSGPGIKKTDIGHLFEAYFTTKGASGTGMGLFLSHQVIKAHGGMIEVKSEEGKGTEFIVRLPKMSSDSRSGINQAA